MFSPGSVHGLPSKVQIHSMAADRAATNGHWDHGSDTNTKSSHHILARLFSFTNVAKTTDAACADGEL